MLIELAHLAALVLAALDVQGAAAPGAATLPGRSALAARHLARLEASAPPVLAALRHARADHDPERTACLDEVLTRAHVAARTGRSLKEAIEAAEEASSPVTADRELARLGLLAERATRLHAEAAACEGRTTEPAGGSRVIAYVPLLPGESDYPAAAR